MLSIVFSVIIEGLYHSMTKMVHKITDPMRKTNKSKSIPNLLLIPPGGSDVNTVQTRSRSFSKIPDESMEHETQKGGDRPNCLIKTSLEATNGMRRQDLKLRRQNLTDKSMYHNQIYENDISTQKDRKKKKTPPKRPPPPKCSFSRDHENVYANLFRSTSDTQIMGTVYANFEQEKLDTKIYRSNEDVSLYVNQFQDARDTNVEEMYIFMTDDVDFDDSGYVIMSRDRSMTP